LQQTNKPLDLRCTVLHCCIWRRVGRAARNDLIREYHGCSEASAAELAVLSCFQEDPGRRRRVIETGYESHIAAMRREARLCRAF
jgi:hypothetical protein